ncbi:putative cytokinin riboside 5'-monophosphate phosphoribohydrolase LOG9, partial [Bienertia sinuspersici]
MLGIITRAQLGIHKKSIEFMLIWINKIFGVKEGFIKQGARDIVVSATNAEELLTKMEKLMTASNSPLLTNMSSLMKAGKCSNW